MIHKGEFLRVYKRILKFGEWGFDRPAKYDWVDIKYKEVKEEILLLEDFDLNKL